MMQKPLKNRPPCHILPDYFIYFQKSERSFFDQVAIDAESVLTFEKCPLVAELKLKT